MNIGDQIRVNNKQYQDLLSDGGDTYEFRIKYKEGKFNIYKNITIPKSIIKKNDIKHGIVYCTIDENSLRKQIGGMVNYIAKEDDISFLLEDAAGMGAVSMPGLSGIPGQIGSMGSGDIGKLVTKPAMKAGTYGLEDISKSLPTMKKLFKKSKKTKNGIKTPLLDVFKENNEIEETDNDYKKNILEFLDYPQNLDIEINFINIIEEEIREELLYVSTPRLVQYFKDLYNTNKNLIKRECSNDFENKLLLLSKI